MAVVTKDGLLIRADLFMTILRKIGPLTRRRLLLSYICRYQEQFTRRMVIPTDGWNRFDTGQSAEEQLFDYRSIASI